MKVGDVINNRRITKILKKFPILYSGWEMDNVGYVVEHERVDRKNINEKRKISYALSGHGIFQLINDNKFIVGKLFEYKKVMAETKEAMRLTGK